MHFPIVTILMVTVALRLIFVAQRDTHINSRKQCVWTHSWNDMFGVEGFDSPRPTHQRYLRTVSRIMR